MVMGRETFDSLPGGRPLKNRLHIVLSQTPRPDLEVLDRNATVLWMDSFEQALESLAQFPEYNVIGGPRIWMLFADLYTDAVLTVIDGRYPADAHFPTQLQHGWVRHGVVDLPDAPFGPNTPKCLIERLARR